MSLNPINLSNKLQESFFINSIPEKGKKSVQRRLFPEEEREIENEPLTASYEEDWGEESETSTSESLISPVKKRSLKEKEEESDSDLFKEERATTPIFSKIDPLKTPPSTPGAKDSFKTPEKVKQLAQIFRDEELLNGGDLFGPPAKLVKEIIQLIQSPTKLTDTPSKRAYSTAVRKIYRDMSCAIKGENPEDFHRNAFKLISDQPLLKSLANSLISADRKAKHKAIDLVPPKEIINIEHLTKVDNQRGFHVFSPEDPVQELLTNKKISPNGIIYAQFPTDPLNPLGKKKCSTFFPPSKGEEIAEMLLDIFSSQEPLAKIANRCLYFSPNKKYVIEVFKEGVGVIKSAFPIFHFSPWISDEIDHEIIAGEPPISGEALLIEAKKAISDYANDFSGKKNNPIRYITEDDSLIIDLAPSLSTLGIAQGIFVQFPRNCFKDILNDEDFDELFPKS